jgi:hypothetical protein
MPIPRHAYAARRERWWRLAIVLSQLWVAMICGIALYESIVIDPWTFIGVNRGPIFFVWTQNLAYSASSFGDITLELDVLRFWLALLLPVILIFTAAAIMPALEWRIRRPLERR